MSTKFVPCDFGSRERIHARASRERTRDCEGYVLSRLASLAIIGELARRLQSLISAMLDV